MMTACGIAMAFTFGVFASEVWGRSARLGPWAILVVGLLIYAAMNLTAWLKKR